MATLREFRRVRIHAHRHTQAIFAVLSDYRGRMPLNRCGDLGGDFKGTYFAEQAVGFVIRLA